MANLLILTTTPPGRALGAAVFVSNLQEKGKHLVEYCSIVVQTTAKRQMRF
jgi:hypothetical protein